MWLALVISLSVLAGVASAQDGTLPTPVPGSQTRTVTSDDVNAIAKQMYCPVCENEPLDACRTAACQQWRAQIAQMLSEGQTEQTDQAVLRRSLRAARAGAAARRRQFVVVVGAAVGGADRRRGLCRAVDATDARTRRGRRGGSAQRRRRPAGMRIVDRVEQDLKDY